MPADADKDREANLPDSRLRFKTERVTIGAGFVKNFQRLEFPRPLREHQVRKIRRSLEAGDHLTLPIVVNDVGRGGNPKYRVLDGNHRLEAIRRVMEGRPSWSIQVEFHIYDHLTEDQEFAHFDKINDVIHVTRSDRIGVMRKKYPILQMFAEQGFPAPVRISGDKGHGPSFGFENLVLAYLARFVEGHGGGNFEARAQALGEDDFNALKGFATAFVDTFGAPGQDNPFSKREPLLAVSKVWFCNLAAHALSPDDLARRFKKIAQGAGVRQVIGLRGQHSNRVICESIVAAMNAGYRSSLAVSPGEYIATLKARKPTDVAQRASSGAATA